MPINQLERHPFLNYRDGLNTEKIKTYKGLVLGSFPIYNLTYKLDEKFEVIENNKNKNDIRLNFFYGSKKSNLWDYIFNAFENINPITKENAIDLLEDNNLIMSDVIYQTNRKNENAPDSDLMINNSEIKKQILNELKLNNSIVEIINKNKGLQNIFFTATGMKGKTPFGWFKDIFGKKLIIDKINYFCGKPWSLTIKIDNRNFNVFLLPTPKPRGIHFTDNSKHQGFCNYLKSVDELFYNQILNVLERNRSKQQNNKISYYREKFLIETYKQALLYNNLYFDGSLKNK